VKPPVTRAMLEVDSLMKVICELSKCPDCSGPVDVEMKTTCVASHVKAACLNIECGCILHSDPLAHTTTHEKSNHDCNRTTDCAVNKEQ